MDKYYLGLAIDEMAEAQRHAANAKKYYAQAGAEHGLLNWFDIKITNTIAHVLNVLSVEIGS
jgi:hypothetical protein